MSADNGVYILKTGSQYRVKHLYAIDNLYWNEREKKLEDNIQLDMILSMFGGCKFTYDQQQAMRIAANIEKNLPICEFGIVMFDVKLQWKDILETCRNYETRTHH